MASKYNNRKTSVSGIQFHSCKEATRYQELCWMQQAGLIQHLELQPRFDLVVNEHKIGKYYADFRYEVVATGLTVVEDVKGVRTAVYQLKKKLVKALYEIDIQEV